jgi:site-specific DNA-methyltransferase (adenine-specific)
MKLSPDFVLDKPSVEVWGGRSCLEVLEYFLESKRTFNTAFADPPFNIGVSYDKHNDKMPPAEYADFTRRWIASLAGVVVPGGAIWINCPEGILLQVMTSAEAAGLQLRRQAIWHYRFGQNQSHNFISSHTNALYYLKPGGEHVWNLSAVLEESDRASLYNDKRTYDKDEPEMVGRRAPLDVWCGPGFARVQGNNKQRRGLHRNQLPEAYLRRALAATTPSGGRVIDPFLGSGTTLAVADQLGFDAAGIELSRDYAKSAFDRIVSAREGRANVSS